MTRAEILAGVAEVARAELGLDPATVAPDARLLEDLGLDSLKLLTLAAAVENRFRVALTPEDDARIATVAELVDAIEQKLIL
jgi:acyl carrier protein